MASAPPTLATALPKPDWAIDLGPTNMAVPTGSLNEFPPSWAPDQVVLVANGKHSSSRPVPNSDDTEILITHTRVYARYNPASQQLWMAVENYQTHVTVNLSNYAQGLQEPTMNRTWSLTWMTFAAFNATIWIPCADWLRPCRRWRLRNQRRQHQCFTNWSPDHAKIVDLWNAQSQQGFPGPPDNHSPDSDAEWAQWGYSSGSDDD